MYRKVVVAGGVVVGGWLQEKKKRLHDCDFLMGAPGRDYLQAVEGQSAE